MQNNRNDDRLEKKRVTIIIVVALVAIIGVLSLSAFMGKDNGKKNIVPESPMDITDLYNSGEDKSEEMKENIVKDIDKAKDIVKEDTQKVKEDLTERKDDAMQTGVNLKNFAFPVSSKEITMPFSLNTKPVFSKTFNEYRSDHNGIDIKASENEQVHAVADGVVSKIVNDEKLGMSVILDHGNNIYTQYANLSSNVKVHLHDKVKKNDVLGYVGKSAKYELLEPAHLHFAVQIKDKYVDPMKYFK